MKHYIAIHAQDQVGKWRVVFPDLPGCEAKEFSLDDAKFSAVATFARCIEAQGGPVPEPMDLATIERNADWLAQNRIDLSKAVISVISLPADLRERSKLD